MPFLDWVNKSNATGVARGAPYHLLKLVSSHGSDEDGAGRNVAGQIGHKLATH